MKFIGMVKTTSVLVLSGLVGAAGQVASAPVAGQSASVQIQQGLRPLKQALDGLTVDRWKAPKEVKETTAANVGSIRKDLEATLPGLLSAADAAPTSVAAMLPVARNLSALYDVVLRVTVVAETSAPQDQVLALEGALTGLDDVRRPFSDRLQAAADAQERQIMALQKQVSVLSVPPPAPPPPAPPVPAATKKKKKAAPSTPPGN